VDREPGEEVFFHGHPSWRALIGFYVKGVLFAVIAGAIAGVVTRQSSHSASVGWVVAVVLVVFVVVLLVGTVRRIRTTYTITNRRLTIDTGLMSRELHETRLERVQNVNSRQSMFQRLLGVGAVDFDTAGSAEYDFTFRGVARPHAIVRTVNRALQEVHHMQPGV
jgi:uncharacterized membrane protein YdbT with pleckstrin-like domain